MRFSILVPIVSCVLASQGLIKPHMAPLSLVELALDEHPVDMNSIRQSARKKFISIMHQAEEKASHDPAVLKAEEQLHVSEEKFKADSHKASEMLASIKSRLAKSKADVAAEEKHAASEAARMKKFTEEENKKLEATEKKLMQLQQKKITSSFAQLPDITATSLLQRVDDGAKAQQEIRTAEKALSELSQKIKKRVNSLKKSLNDPGHQFPGEVVL
jgi:hypothetical protein